MDQTQRDHILDDLRGLVKGELLFDELSRNLYSTDASVFQVQPLGVALPRDEEDVRAIVLYAAEHQISVVPRGAGTGLAGESLGTGLIVDLSCHFRSIIEIEGDTVRVQPGVVYRYLNEQLARVGRRFAPDPTNGVPCTIGGMLATNASGARALKHGYTRDHVSSLRCILDNGAMTNISQYRRGSGAETTPARLGEIVAGVSALLERHASVIRGNQPRTPFNRCGYLLADVLDPAQLDLARLLVGSEGTLALFTEATLRTVPLPAGRSLVLLGFADLDTALQAAQRVLPSQPSACELIDRRLLSLARGLGTAAHIPGTVEAVLLVEYETDSPLAAQTAAAELLTQVQLEQRTILYTEIALGSEQVDKLWGLRELAVSSLYGMQSGPQPLAFVEDIGVPPAELLHFIHRAQEVLQRHEATASFLAHAVTGQVHIRPFLNLQKPEDASRLYPLADAIYTLVFEIGGTISSQHGTGLARTPWVNRQYGPLYDVMRELKNIFDPQHIFNPGKIIGPDPAVPAWPLRLGTMAHSSRANREQSGDNGRGSGVKEMGSGVRSQGSGVVISDPERSSQNSSSGDAPIQSSPLTTHHSPLTTHLSWQLADIWDEVTRCNGCGTCRTETPALRMCPIFRASQTEAGTPRAKANLLRYLLQENTDPQLIDSRAARDLADLCVNCKMCASECPARVNIPKLMLELKAANVARHGLTRSDWFLSKTETLARLGSTFSVLANTAIGSRTIRWFAEKFFGLSRRRRLPTFARTSFLERARQRGWDQKPAHDRPRVAYFVDVYANYIDPLIAEAVVAVLRHNGIDVYVPPEQFGCGMTPLAYGDVESARETVTRNLSVLAELARSGWPILCSEPTAALMLRHDALDLVDDADARLVADRVVEASNYLGSLHDRGRLSSDFDRLDFSVGHHVPCHLKALGQPPAGPRLLALIPGLRVQTIDVSCSGMAGTFGLKAENYEMSHEAGRPMLDELARPRFLFGSTECSSCRLQMEDGTRKRTLHPIQYLALSYGLMPELYDKLREPIGELRL